MKTITISHRLKETPIEFHPCFHKPKTDWRVSPARWDYDYDDDGDIIPESGVYVEENRSAWIPEEDGKSMSDFWDDETRTFKKGSPLESMSGIDSFLRPVMITTIEES